MTYADYIKGKRVIFVGAAPLLREYDMADFIDNFDIVVRTNGSIDLLNTDEFSSRYGKRVDVLYTNNQFYREMSPLPVRRYAKQGVKFMCMKTCKPMDKTIFSRSCNVRTFKEVIKNVCTILPSAAMGCFIYTDILKYNPKELFVAGVDFFASKKKVFEHNNYQEYFPGYLPPKIVKQGNRINAGKKEDGHSFLGNANYIYRLYTRYNNFKIHDVSLRILNGIVSNEVKQL